MRRTTLALLFGTVICAQAAGQELSLRARVERHGGDFRETIGGDFAQVDLRRVVSEADTIVVATINHGVPVLANNETELHTDYHVTVEQVLRHVATARVVAGDMMIVRRDGGATVLAGHNLVVSDPQFEPFKESETYVLFLQTPPAEPYFRLPYRGQSAFRVMNGSVRQAFSGPGTWNQGRDAVSMSAFVEEVRQLMAAR
jgi:hypothetical protein